MIIPQLTLDAIQFCGEPGSLYLESNLVNLDEETLTVPVVEWNGTGTLEFFRNHIVFHSANGVDTTLTPLELLRSMLAD